MSDETIALNGGDAAPIQAVNPVVKLLEDALIGAKNGHIASVAVVAVNPAGAISTLWSGPRKGDLHLGCAIMGSALLDDITGVTRPRVQQQGKILRPMV